MHHQAGSRASGGEEHHSVAAVPALWLDRGRDVKEWHIIGRAGRVDKTLRED